MSRRSAALEFSVTMPRMTPYCDDPPADMTGKLRGVDATTTGYERDCTGRAVRRNTYDDRQVLVHSQCVHFELLDHRDDFPVGDYEVTFDRQTEKLTKRTDGHYWGRV
jgi:hypothetical protein